MPHIINIWHIFCCSKYALWPTCSKILPQSLRAQNFWLEENKNSNCLEKYLALRMGWGRSFCPRNLLSVSVFLSGYQNEKKRVGETKKIVSFQSILSDHSHLGWHHVFVSKQFIQRFSYLFLFFPPHSLAFFSPLRALSRFFSITKIETENLHIFCEKKWNINFQCNYFEPDTVGDSGSRKSLELIGLKYKKKNERRRRNVE